MVSYMDEKAMNVAQELSDRELYNYDVLVKPGWLIFRPAPPAAKLQNGSLYRSEEDQ